MSRPTPLNIALLGPTGAGKGTHAASLSARFHLDHVATGDLFRDNLESGTALGRLAKKYMDVEELVPDEVVDAMVEEWCQRVSKEKGLLFDGFPRTNAQARYLETMLQRLGRTLDAVIYVDVPDAEVLRRLEGRRICHRCQQPYHLTANPSRLAGRCDECGGELYRRPDDTAERVTARLRVFHRATDPVLDHFTAAGRLIIVSGEGSLNAVEDRLIRACEGLRNRAYGFATARDRAEIARPPVTPPVAAHAARATRDLVLLGGPGSGKGTQATRLSTKLALPHIATGDLFRENLRQATELGRLAKTYMDRGDLVPDDVTEAMVAERLGRPDARDGFILDGFPRTRPQAHALTEMLTRLERRLTAVVLINVSDQTLVDRISGRLICRRCQAPYHATFKPPQQAGVCDVCGGELYQRSDDNPATVRARLVTYHHQTEPLIAYYRGLGLLREIDGEHAVDDITSQLLATLQDLAPRGDFVDTAGTR